MCCQYGYDIWLIIASGSRKHGQLPLCTRREVLQSLRIANGLLLALERISCLQTLAMALKFAVLLVCVYPVLCWFALLIVCNRIPNQYTRYALPPHLRT